MSYLVLARKYRPSSFAEVVGQEHVTRTLGNAFATGRVHHAFLFCGPRGCGKTTLARIVGKALNCEAVLARSPESPDAAASADRDAAPRSAGSAEPCGVCAACRSISNGSAVDYQEMDGASNRGIDAIRELTEAVRYQPAVLRKKVYVIDEVHMLTTEAFNALLKTLEEPPPHVTFVLATTEPHKLPNTILSRCQRYDFKLVPASRLAQHLTSIFAKEHLSVEPGAVSLVVRESGGSVRDALSLSDQLISYVGEASSVMTERHVAEVLGVADRSLTRTLVRALAGGDAGAALAAVESAIERGVDEVQLARAIVRYLRDLSVLQVAPGQRGLVDATEEELAELLAEAGELDRSRATQMFERMLRCCDELGKTLQPRLVLDCALIDVATIEPLVPLGDLIERLTELEGRIAGRAARAGGGGGTKDRARPGPGAVTPASPRQPVQRTGSSGASGSPGSPGSGDPPASPRAADGVAPSAPVGSSRRYEAVGSQGASRVEDSASTPAMSGSAAGSSPRYEVVRAPGSEGTPGSGGTPGSEGTPGTSRGEEPAPPMAGSAVGASRRYEVVGAPGASSGPGSSGPGSSGPGSPGPGSSGPGSSGPGSSGSGSPGPGSPGSSARHDNRDESAVPRGASPAAATAGGGELSAPVSMQPSGPVPRPEVVASGSGPHGQDAATRPALAVPENPSDALRAWNEVLGELESLRKFSLLGPFQHARVMQWTPELLELGFPVEVHSMGDMAKDSTDELRTIVRGLGPAQHRLRVTVRLLDDGESRTTGARSILETTRERTSAERTRREEEARAHPITKHVLQTFGAQIKEIKTDV
jgi:DNA polymerase-3 subunit gamma/tau